MNVTSRTLLLCALLSSPAALAAKPKAPAAAKSAPGASAKGLLGTNLLTDPGAETAERENLTGWTLPKDQPDAQTTSESYGGVAGEWDTDMVGAPEGGTRYFRLGFQNGQRESTLTQAVDVAPLAKTVDAGKVEAKVSGYVGGFLKADSTVVLVASFQDADGKELGTLETKPYDSAALPKPEAGSASLVAMENTGAVPAQTRRIVFKVVARATGTSGDYLGLADNLALTLSEKH